ncbi:cilia- and flagella-associated protein 299-like [Aricia agestis]|uniref:cilia- and flagella-associated protein 299-like n=1 Tax=Aricia agestis TaxID=91739 RepID=UPI001C20A605|nr:cilia- and flagella-associated protein 299-like [Aricia agestis]
MEEQTEYPPSVEADKNLLPYETFDEYLDSLIGIPDLRNLRSIETARTIAALGYRTCGDTLEEREFYRRRAVIHAKEFPVVKPFRAVSAGLAHTDPLNKELADREKANRLGILNSVIFVRNTTRSGFEVSGYIDFAHRLATEDWEPFFTTTKVLRPRETDLGYYFWRLGVVRSNVTRNWKPLMDGERGLVFQNRHDHKLLSPDPQADPGQATTRVRVFSPRYLQVEIYDHVVRRKT